jgi:hypothetical protein
MYSSARAVAWRRAASLAFAGSGTTAPIGSACSGLVPQVTIGSSAAASRLTSRSKRAPSSVGSERQYASAASHRAPCGANGRPAR